jgi:hypothetical protein
VTPEEQAMIENYWGISRRPDAAPAPAAPPPALDLGAMAFGGAPKPPPALVGAPPPVPAPPPAPNNAPIPQDFQAKLDAALGPPRPAPGVMDPVTRAPEWDPSTINPKTIQFAPPGQPAAAAAPIGPTASDDAEFQRAMAKLGGTPKPTPATAPRPAGKANPDPFGIRAAQKGLLDTYDTRANALRQIQSAEADKAAVVGDHRAELARRHSEDASIAGMEQDYAARHFDEKMTELERQLDDVATKKIDPQRLMKETPGLGFMAIIGGAIGGFYQGLTRSGENPFLKELNIMIDRDIAAQEKEIDTGIRGANQQMGLLAQQRAIFQDTQQAKMAAQALYYQSAEDQLMAEAARYDQPIYKARAEEAAAQIQAEKQALLLKIAEQQRAQSAAAAGQAFTREKEVHAMYRDVYDKVLGATGNPAMAEQEARRQIGVVFSPSAVQPRAAAVSADPLALVPKDQRSEAVKELQSHANKDKVVSAISKSFQDWRDTSVTSPARLNSTRSAISGTIMANVPGIRSDVDFKEIVEPNLPSHLDSEETLRHKEATIRQFVESKTTTPILDAHAPGWRPKEIVRKDVK